ncbi:unnamed protein product [Urochloa humidicola]
MASSGAAARGPSPASASPGRQAWARVLGVRHRQARAQAAGGRRRADELRSGRTGSAASERVGASQRGRAGGRRRPTLVRLWQARWLPPRELVSGAVGLP